MFICGSGSFNNQDDVENEQCNSPCPTPKRSRRSTSFCKIIGKDNSNKNPYADRGLDKFYALLADLDDKKQRIYTQKGSEEISFVRFVYTNDDSNNVKPIVVKVKEKKEKGSKNLIEQRSFKNNNNNNNNVQADAGEKKIPSPMMQSATLDESGNDQRRKKRRCVRCENLRRPQCYFLVMVVMILLFLAIYGRSFAILCTSIGWYLAPNVVKGSPSAAFSSERKPKRKKSERKIVHSAGPSSPKSVINGLHES